MKETSYSSSQEEDITNSCSDEFSSTEASSYEETDNHSDLPMDDRFYTTLHNAAENNDSELCKQLIERYPNAVTDVTDVGYTPLDLAAINGCLDSFKILIAKMEIEDIYAKRSFGYTILELLLIENEITQAYLEIFQILISEIPESRMTIEGTSNEIIIDAYRNSPKLLTINFSDLLRLADSKGNEAACRMILKKSPSTVAEGDANKDNTIATHDTINNMKLVPDILENSSIEDIAISYVGHNSDL